MEGVASGRGLTWIRDEWPTKPTMEDQSHGDAGWKTWRHRRDVDARGKDSMGGSLWLNLGLVLVTALGILAVLAKVWRVTPLDGGPLYRVSVVDRMQARMLHRRAMESAALGDDSAAVHGLRGAAANNAGNADVLRDWIRLAIRSEDGLAEVDGVPLAQAVHLLRLGGTNASDVDLTMKLLWKLEMRDEMVRLGESMGDRLGKVGAGLLAMAYFDAGDMGSFDATWRRHGAAMDGEVDVSLRREAWKAQWGPPGTSREGMARLVEAQGNPATRLLALELARRIAAARADTAEHERLLRLQLADGSAGTREIVEWWLLLASTGRLDAARRAARELVPVLGGRRASETRMAATALLTLNLAPEAVKLLESAAVARHRDMGLWMLRAGALRALGRWEDLGMFATDLLQRRGAGRDALALGMVLRAASESKLGQPDLARAAVRTLVDSAEVDGGMLVRMAGWLAETGLREEALALMRRAEAAMSGNPSYWAQRTLLAGGCGNMDDMVESSRRALGFAPADPRLRNNHAAALIAARQEPAEAVLLTLQNVQQFPLEPKYRVNHALALLANDRVAEARKALDEVATAAMPPEQEASLHLAWTELLVLEGKMAEARQRMARINRSLLLPFQEARLDEIAGRL